MYNNGQTVRLNWTIRLSDFTQIQTFIEVAESGSFAEAGRKLALPRSTISARVHSLESRLGIRFFNRNPRNVSLTNEGQDYLDHCQQALALINNAEEKLSKKHALSGTVRLSVPFALPKLPLARLITAFHKKYPDLHVNITVSDTPQDLVSSNIDLAIRGRSVGDLDLIARTLGESKVGYFASPVFLKDHQEKGAKKLIETFCLFEPGKTAAADGKVRATDFQLIKELLLQDYGIAALPESFCKQEVKAGTLQKVRTNKTPASLPLYLVYPNRVHMAPRVRVMIDFIMANHKKFEIS